MKIFILSFILIHDDVKSSTVLLIQRFLPSESQTSLTPGTRQNNFQKLQKDKNEIKPQIKPNRGTVNLIFEILLARHLNFLRELWTIDIFLDSIYTK